MRRRRVRAVTLALAAALFVQALPARVVDGWHSLPAGSTLPSSADAAALALNTEASRGFRLVSLDQVQVWRAADDAPEYRILVEPSYVQRGLALRSPSAARALFLEALDGAAQLGFRVHPNARLPEHLGPAVVLERVPRRSSACAYGFVADVTAEGATVAPGHRPLPVALSLGVLTESCPSDDPPTELRLKRLPDAFGLLSPLETNERRTLDSLARASALGCRYFVTDGLDLVVLCDPARADAVAEYRIVTFKRVRVAELPTPADYSEAQTALAALGAQGYCLAGAWGDGDLLLEKPRTTVDRCEYRLVVAAGDRLVSIVDRALAQGFLPTVRAPFPRGVILERRRPVEGPAPW